MTIQTRISGLLFFLLLAVTAGNALVIQEALLTSTRIHAEDVARVAHDRARLDARVAARTGALAIRSAVERNLDQLSSRAEILAAGLHTRALQEPDLWQAGIAEQLVWGIQAIPPPGAFLAVVSASGQLLTSVPPLDSGRSPDEAGLQVIGPVPQASHMDEIVALGLTGSSFAGLKRLPPKWLRAQQDAGSKTPQGEAPSSGKLVGSEQVAPAGLPSLTGETRPATPTSSPALVVVHPIGRLPRLPVGVVVAGYLLRDLPSFGPILAEYPNGEHLSYALLDDAVQVVAQGTQSDSNHPSSPGPVLEALRPEGEVEIDKDGTISIRLPLRLHGQEERSIVEVTAPIATPPFANTVQIQVNQQGQLFEDGVTMTGFLGILALILGIFGTRGQVSGLVRLRARVASLAHGDLNSSFREFLGSDEVGQIGRSLERIRNSLRESQKEESRPTPPGASPGKEGSGLPARQD